jgi:hypothetical protein
VPSRFPEDRPSAAALSFIPPNNNYNYCFSTQPRRMLHYICGMSSTREIPSNAEIEALAAKIRVLRSKQARTTFQTLLSLISSSAGDSPIEILSKWLSQTELTENIVKVFRPILPIQASVRD